jgi:hypothetical protein
MRSPVKPRRGCRWCDGKLIGREMDEGLRLEESRTGWLNDVAFIFVNIGKAFVFFYFPPFIRRREDNFPST